MDNLIENLRFRNVFQGAQTPPTFPSPNVQAPVFGSEQVAESDGPRSQFEAPDDINTHAHDALDKFLESINSMPNREDYKPSKWRNIGAGIIGAFEGGNAGSNFRTKKYDTAVDDWKLKNSALGTAAGQERLANSADSLEARRIKQGEEATARIAQGDERIRQGDERIALDRKSFDARQTVEKWKQEHPDYDLKIDSTGEYVFFNPKNPLEAPVKTGINSGNLSDTDRINLQGKLAKEVAAVPRTTVTSGTTTTIDPNAKRDAGDPAKEKIRVYNNARKAVNTSPEYAQYVKFGEAGTNDVEFDPKTPQEIMERLQGLTYTRPGDIDLDNSGPKPKVTTRKSTSVSSRGTAPVSRFGSTPAPKVNAKPADVPKGRILVQDAKGNVVGSIPDSPQQRALAKTKGLIIVEPGKK